MVVSLGTVSIMAQSQSDTVLSTGMGNLDDAFRDEGLLPGSVVTVVGQPESLAETVAFNMSAGRPTYYFSSHTLPADVETQVEEAAGVDHNDLTVVDVADMSVAELREEIADLNIDEPSTVIVDPVNGFEGDSESSYRQFAREIQSLVADTGSMAVLHAVGRDEDPGARWMTLAMSDYVFRVIHEVGTDGIDDYLALSKVDPRQELVGDGDGGGMRVFNLKRELDVRVGTARNVSP